MRRFSRFFVVASVAVIGLIAPFAGATAIIPVDPTTTVPDLIPSAWIPTVGMALAQWIVGAIGIVATFWGVKVVRRALFGGGRGAIHT